jgi:hypothetical protein
MLIAANLERTSLAGGAGETSHFTNRASSLPGSMRPPDLRQESRAPTFRVTQTRRRFSTDERVLVGYRRLLSALARL